MRYLLVTHIPFRPTQGGGEVDALWARDIRATSAALGPIRIAAPEIRTDRAMATWGAGTVEVTRADGIEFTGLPSIGGRKDAWKRFQLRAALRREVRAADIVHTSNYFPPYLGLAYAHDLAVRLGRKTVFVVAEDFHDMLEWEWVRTAPGPIDRRRRMFTLASLDRRVRRSAASASLTFLHTPAAVERYRLYASNGIAIRQPAHELGEVISEHDLAARNSRARRKDRLVIAAACRHSALKGVDHLIRAIGMLEQRGVCVEARLFGSGVLTTEWTRLAERLGVADRVAFRGALPPGEALFAELRSADLFAMPHRTTDFGRAFFDAMAAGLPVIAFRSAASESTVRDGIDGLLSPMDDIESLAASLHRFHLDRDLLVKASLSARDRALTNTATIWHKIRAARILELVQEPAQHPAPAENEDCALSEPVFSAGASTDRLASLEVAVKTGEPGMDRFSTGRSR